MLKSLKLVFQPCLDFFFVSGNGGSRKESPSKRVSFMPPVESREEQGEDEDEEEEDESDQELEEREASVDREEQDPNVSSFVFLYIFFLFWMWILILIPPTQPAFHSHHLETNLMVNLSLCSSRPNFPLHYSSVFRLPSKV